MVENGLGPTKRNAKGWELKPSAFGKISTWRTSIASGIFHERIRNKNNVKVCTPYIPKYKNLTKIVLNDSN